MAKTRLELWLPFLPFCGAVLLLSLVSAWILWAALNSSPSGFSYTLDDPYIHMVIARNWAERGVWGAQPECFTSSTSSPLWTFGLGLVYWAFGDSPTAPLVLNLLCAWGVLGCVALALRRNEIVGWRQLVVLMLVAFLTPLPNLVFSGMEHTAHVLFAIGIAGSLYEVLKSDGRSRYGVCALLGFVCIGAGVRYETLLMACMAGLVLLLVRQWKLTLLVWGVAWVVPCVFGLWAVMKGWHFLPNSVLVRSQVAASGTIMGLGHVLPDRFLRNIAACPGMKWWLIVSVIVAGITILRRSSVHPRLAPLMLCFHAGVVLLHLLFGQVGWFYRYEAYLVGTGVLLFALTLAPWLRTVEWKSNRLRMATCAALILALGWLGVTFCLRAAPAMSKVPAAMKNIADQQGNMAAFVRNSYPRCVLAANDIGRLLYETDVRLVDLCGICDRETLDLRRRNALDREAFSRLTRERAIDMAILYPQHFQNALPPEWRLVGIWRIANNVVCDSDTVGFYSVNPDIHAGLVAALRSFSQSLPKDVEWFVEPPGE